MVDENAPYAAQIGIDRKLRAKYESALAAKHSLATLIAEYIKYLGVNGRTSVKGINVTELTLMQLFEHEWLDDDIVNLYAELLV